MGPLEYVPLGIFYLIHRCMAPFEEKQENGESRKKKLEMKRIKLNTSHLVISRKKSTRMKQGNDVYIRMYIYHTQQ